MTGTTSTGCFYWVRTQNSRVDYNGTNVNDMQLSAIDPSRSKLYLLNKQLCQNFIKVM